MAYRWSLGQSSQTGQRPFAATEYLERFIPFQTVGAFVPFTVVAVCDRDLAGRVPGVSSPTDH